MPSPLYSGAAAIMLGTMTARADLGWAFFEKLRAADAVAVRGNGAVMTAVANGEKSYGVLVDFMAFNAKAKGSPIDFIFPAEGLPAVTEPVAILRTTQNAAAARAFVDFILSDHGQKLAVSMGYIPARASVGMPSWYPAGAKINLMPTDIPKIVQTNSANLKRFADLFSN
jgi:iron(III) transport system substrate-binding protein